MRSIPAALQSKLNNRFKATSTDSAPNIRLVATQTSVNTLLTEPIHEDIAPAYGDVAVRQMEGDHSLYCAYAICLDNGVATIYRRKLPASMDYKWEYWWTFGTATDVAIEFDGEWKMDATHEWYYLQTKEYPYIFTVEDGSLYVQYWNQSESKTLLATEVSQISSCKGWKNSIDIELDQGLIIGYLKGGEVYYRSLCTQEDGSVLWEAERKAGVLGSGNTSIAVIRTNDFRIGFLTENKGEMLLALTYRNYAGMSVRPETVHVSTDSAFAYLRPRIHNAHSQRERVTASVVLPYFNLDNAVPSPEIAVVSRERLNREDTFYSYGCKLILDKPLYGVVEEKMITGSTMSVLNGTATSTVAITAVEYDSEEQALVFKFASDIKRTCQLTLTTPSTRFLSYYRLQNEKWYIPTFSAVFEPETNRLDGYSGRDYATVIADASVWIDIAEFWETANRETVCVTSAASVTLTPVSSLPI